MRKTARATAEGVVQQGILATVEMVAMAALAAPVAVAPEVQTAVAGLVVTVEERVTLGSPGLNLEAAEEGGRWR